MKFLILHFESKGLLNDAVILHVYIKSLFDFLKIPTEIEIRSTAAQDSKYVQESQSLTYPGKIKPDVIIHIQDVDLSGFFKPTSSRNSGSVG